MLGAFNEVVLKLRPRWPEMIRAAIGTQLAVDNVIVVGAGKMGQLLAGDLASNSRYRISCFVDDDPRRWGTYVRGVRVSGSVDHLPELTARHQPTLVVIAIAGPPGALVRRVADYCARANVRVRAVRGFALSDDTAALRPLDIEELLERTSVDLDTPTARAYITGKTVLVIGAAGSIGSEICRQVSQLRPERLLLLDVSESGLHDLAEGLPDNATLILGDIRDRRLMHDVIARCRPDVVFHAAAYKHVAITEEQPLAALSTNVVGTANVLSACADCGVERFVFISSDKAVEPESVLGLTKRFGELLTVSQARAADRLYASVRFGNVLGSSGSVVPIFNRQLDHGGPLTVTHPDATRYFMTIREAAGLVIQAGAVARVGDLLVLDMGAPLSVLELAEKMVRLRGLRPDDVGIQYTGLRPGEKLRETLIFPHETTVPSGQEGVLRIESKTKEPALDEITAAFESIEECLREMDAKGALRLLAEVVGAKNLKWN
jgi:FlaA1/EpsC-like NDP-sugar epimerase